jgi:endonuclease/exonuclease/phosphatase (EEP) superfamily protein YafD
MLITACHPQVSEQQRQQWYQRCGQQLYPADVDKTQLAGIDQHFSVLIWNLQKAQQPGLLPELKALAADKDLLLLQEATLSPLLIDKIERKHRLYFAPGYQTAAQDTGVLTASRVEPIGRCNLSSMEPLLRTPKATALSLYAIAGSEQTLLVINIHGVNFSIGTEALRAQLQQSIDWISRHQGPIVFAGDFNTWSDERQALVDDYAGQLGLQPLLFRQDFRTTVFDRALDHIYVRGLTVIETSTIETTTSDHNPLMAKLMYDPTTAAWLAHEKVMQ